MLMSNAAAESWRTDVNIAPLIDPLMVLLVVFMVIVQVLPIRADATALQPARQDAPTQAAVLLPLLQGVHGDAKFGINRQEAFRQNMPVRLADLYANRAQPKVFIQGDNRLSFTRGAEAIDFNHAAEMDQARLMPPKASRGLQKSEQRRSRITR